jgi:hypothetical protein
MKKFQYLALLLAAFMTISCEKDIVNNQDVDSDQTIVNNDDDNDDNNTNNGDNGHDVIVDWAPLELFVYLSDADGNNLLDPEYEHAYDSTNMVLTYEGEEYEVINYLTPSEPKAQPMEYLAVFDSPYICRDTKGVARLTIGEWARNDKWDMATVEVAWGDGTKDTFAFSHDYTYDPEYRNDAEHSWGYTFISQFYLNGEPNADCVYRLVK